MFEGVPDLAQLGPWAIAAGLLLLRQELRHIARTVSDHETRLRQMEGQR
ncbi:hypothetical protein [Arenibaculum sp.]|jgi:hypothetical protein|nr:hypothetical protein [Arenibaculum sp.]